ncbi:uncharacterized protein L203_105940 [Cryptococcus depauperatus CBS 7841]|uniref:Uncharacterized protein n=1 Tax=Cryptococcus depauperatus CBS 7841 TaxID=1295531 RepID=A0AAJ8JY77_9TREE
MYTSELLGEDCGFVGVERDDGKEEGDYRMMLMIRSSLTWVVGEANARRANWYIPYTPTMTNLDFVLERKATYSSGLRFDNESRSQRRKSSRAVLDISSFWQL